MNGQLKQATEGLRLPGGKGVETGKRAADSVYYWSQRGGYANGVLGNLIDSAEANGWEHTNIDYSGSGAGNNVGAGNHYVKDGWQLDISRNYGVTKASNYFSISIHPVEVK